MSLIHSDVSGPMEVASLGDKRYFLTFIDDCTRKVFVYFLKSKTEVLEKFKIFKNFVENQANARIKVLRSDNGTEYVNKAMKQFLEKSGIHHETAVRYTPEQNGVTERMNRTLVEKAKCMLFEANLPVSFWAEAISTTAYIVNRCPSKALIG